MSRRLAVASVAAAAAIAVAVPSGLVWIGSQAVLFPFWYRPGLPPVAEGEVAWETWQGVVRDPERDLGLAYENVEFAAEDGTTLRGWWVPAEPSSGRAVITTHGGASDRRDFLRHVPFLHDASWDVLLFDCREHGRSDNLGRGISIGFRESRDVSSAVAWARGRGASVVAVLGTSQGGSSAIIAGARDPAIDAVIAENPVASVLEVLQGTIHMQRLWVPEILIGLMRDVAVWRFGASGRWEAIDVVAEVSPRPLLLMHGTADGVVPPRHSELLFARAREPKQLWRAEGADHMRLFNRHPEEYAERVLAFLGELE